MKRIAIGILLITLSYSIQKAKAQDHLFSQFFNAQFI